MDDRVQLVVARARVSSIWLEANLRIGDVVWVSHVAARHLLENGICVVPGTPGMYARKPMGPAETKPAGPAETKQGDPEPEEEPERPKFAGGAQAGRSIASPSSNASGAATLSCVSAAVLVPPQRLSGLRASAPPLARRFG